MCGQAIQGDCFLALCNALAWPVSVTYTLLTGLFSPLNFRAYSVTADVLVPCPSYWFPWQVMIQLDANSPHKW